MRTEDELRSALALLEERADSYRAQIPAPELGRSPRAHRARLVISVLATAAAVAAIAIAVPLLGHNRAPATGHPAGGATHSTASTPTPRPTPTILTVRAPKAFDLRRYYFAIDRMNGVTFGGGTLFRDLQQAELDTGDGGHYDLTLNARGAWRPQRPVGARTVTVNGRPGFYGLLRALPMGVASAHPVGLAWQYAPGAWASVAPWDKDAVPLDRAKLVAEAVHPGAASALTVPVTVPTLPAGLHYSGVVWSAAGTRTGQHGYSGFDCLLNFDSTPTGPTLTIDVAGPGMGYLKRGRRVQVNERTGYVSDDAVLVVGSDFVANVQQLPAQPSGQLKLSEAQLVRIARSLTFVARVPDYTDWIDATTALP
jgi:hypothetical protein